MCFTGTCMHCKRGINLGETAWTVNVHHEKAEERSQPDGSQRICIQVIDAWEILCVCEECMKKHTAEWMQAQAFGSRWLSNDLRIRESPNGEL